MMKVAVLGGGNGALAAAADLSEQGNEVRLWRRNASALQGVRQQGGLLLKDFKGERRIALDLVSGSIDETLAGAELIVSPSPAYAQQDIARTIAPHLADGQVIFLPPGSFGSFIMLKALREAGCEAEVDFAETGTLPWLARKHAEDVIAITTRATRLPTGAFPSARSSETLALISSVFPAIEPVENALSAALMNAGPIIHPPLILMNAGPIEHFEHWDIHNEGTQPAIRRVTDRLDGERVAIRKALGYQSPHFPLADHYDDNREEWMYGNVAHEKLTDSGDWREKLDLTAHRYMTEDIGVGLSFLVSVGHWAGVPCPVAEALLSLGSAVSGADYATTGRTLKNIGLSGLDKRDLTSLLHDGI